MTHVTTHLTLVPKRLLLRSLRKLTLKRILLSTVTSLFPCVRTLTLRQGTAFPCLVQRNRVNLMNLTMRTVSLDFFGNIHAIRIQLSNRGTHAFLYLFRITPETFSRSTLDLHKQRSIVIKEMPDPHQFLHSISNRSKLGRYLYPF